jgi:hypothetical protein
MKLTTTTLATAQVIHKTGLAPSTAVVLFAILDMSSRGLRCYTPDIASIVCYDRPRTLQCVQNLRTLKWVSTQPVAIYGKRSLEIRPTQKALDMIQEIKDKREAIEAIHSQAA